MGSFEKNHSAAFANQGQELKPWEEEWDYTLPPAEGTQQPQQQTAQPSAQERKLMPWEEEWDYDANDPVRSEVRTEKANTPTPTPNGGKSSLMGGVVSAMQGPTLGFYDEAVGAVGAAVEGVGNLTPWGTGRSMEEAYRHHRDAARQTVADYEKDNPFAAHVERAVASVPLALANPLASVGKAVAGTGGMLAQASRVGAATGAVAGIGDSTSDTATGMAGDAALGALGGAVAGPVITGALGVGGKVVRNLAGRAGMAEYSPMQETVMRKIGEAINRDAAAGRPGVSDMSGIPEARLRSLGDEATVADLGQNTRSLLDTLATLPGQTKAATERAIHDRQAGRANRMIDAAREGLSPAGGRLPETLQALDEERSRSARYLYTRIRNTNVPVGNDLAAILDRAQGAFGEARKLAALNGERFELDNQGATALNTLFNSRGQQSAPLSQLDTLKRTLYDLEQSHINPETGRLNEMGRAYQNLRRDLVGALDRATTNPATGQSFYKLARDAYAGPSELRTAASLGYQAMSKDAWKIREIMDGMSDSEKQAFKIGVFEAVRKKMGTEAGQTQIVKMWKEPATAEKMKEAFGNPFHWRYFATKMAQESRLKPLESVGRGSQTASRATGLGDIDMTGINEAGNAARSMASGNISGVLNAAANAWNRVATPEPVRNEMGKQLLQKGKDARSVVERVQEHRRKRLEAERLRAAMGGVLGGSAQMD